MYIGRTWTWGRLYLDICGSMGADFMLGIAVAYDRSHPAGCWAKRVSLYLGFGCISVGWD